MKSLLVLLSLFIISSCTPAKLYVHYEPNEHEVINEISILKLVPRSKFDSVLYKISTDSRWSQAQRAPVAHLLPGTYRIGIQTSEDSISIQTGDFPETKIAVFDLNLIAGKTYTFRYGDKLVLPNDGVYSKDKIYWPAYFIDGDGVKIKPIKYLDMKIVNYSDQSAD